MAIDNSIASHNKTLIAGVTGELAALLVAPLIPHLFKKVVPKLRHSLVSSVAHRVMTPWMNRFEPIMENMFQSVELRAKWNAAKEDGVEQKALFMAEKAVDIVMTFPGSYLSSLAANWAVESKLLGGRFSFARFNEGGAMEGIVHIGTMIGGPQVIPNQLASMKSWLCKFLEKHGMKSEAAESASQNMIYSEMGGGLGFTTNIIYRTLREKFKDSATQR